MPYAPVNDVQTTLSHEHTRARNMVVSVQHPTVGEIKLVNTPVKYSDSKPGIRTPPPTLGQHTNEVLEKLLGMEPTQVENLKAAGVIA